MDGGVSLDCSFERSAFQLLLEVGNSKMSLYLLVKYDILI